MKPNVDLRSVSPAKCRQLYHICTNFLVEYNDLLREAHRVLQSSNRLRVTVRAIELFVRKVEKDERKISRFRAHKRLDNLSNWLNISLLLAVKGDGVIRKGCPAFFVQC